MNLFDYYWFWVAGLIGMLLYFAQLAAVVKSRKVALWIFGPSNAYLACQLLLLQEAALRQAEPQLGTAGVVLTWLLYLTTIVVGTRLPRRTDSGEAGVARGES
jgi:hypothetical protein